MNCSGVSFWKSWCVSKKNRKTRVSLLVVTLYHFDAVVTQMVSFSLYHSISAAVHHYNREHIFRSRTNVYKFCKKMYKFFLSCALEIFWGHMRFLKSESFKVAFGREFLQKNVAECIFRHILQDTIFLWNGEMYNFVWRLILSHIFLCIVHGFLEIIPFPVPLPLKLLERNL